MATCKFDCERGIVVDGRDSDLRSDGYNNRGEEEMSRYRSEQAISG